MSQKANPAGQGRGARNTSENRLNTRESKPRPRQYQLDDDLPDVRTMWWRLRNRGIELPAERGVIVIPNWWRR
jgi:hypothetical protein